VKIIRLQAEGFKRLVAVDISPEGDLVEVRGNNAEGKSSVLDSIFAALGGAAAAPIKPVRTGEEYAIIRADLGDLKVTRYFGADGADRLTVENGEGAKYSEPQTMLNKLVGRIAFDPLAFARMKPTDQAAELRRLVPLRVDLDALAAADKADVAARRDVNRDAKALRPRIDAISVPATIPERPDRAAIVAALANAGNTNAAIERERHQRELMAREAEQDKNGAFGSREEAKRLRARADELDAQAERLEKAAEDMTARVVALSPLDAPVDTAKLSAELQEADRVGLLLDQLDYRASLAADFEALRAKSESYTAAIEARAKERADALAEAEMPVPGLSLATVDDEAVVTFEGEPFAQASGAQQLRVSMALAMAANPKLRVMLIKDGSLLDANGLKLVRELAAERDYQVWLEAVGEGDGVGIIMEGGKVRGAPEPERVDAPKRRRAKPAEADGAQDQAQEEALPMADPIPNPAARAPRRQPAAMRDFTTKPLGGDLFGKE
jgi:hypothetical protein